MAGYTEAQRDALRAAIAAGVTRVAYGDKSVDYRSLSDMRQILAGIEAELADIPMRRTFRTTTRDDKGL